MNKKSRIDSKLTLNKSKDSKDDKNYEELELHVLVATHNQWRPDLWQAWDRGASLSIGFIRTPPNITLFDLRSILIIQLKGENLPDQYAYLRHVGRGSTVCSSRQERTLMARDFAPPFYPNPELCILSADDSMAFQTRYIADNSSSLNNSLSYPLPAIITNSPNTPIHRPMQMYQQAILPQLTPNTRFLQTSAPMQHPSLDRAKSPSFRSLQNQDQHMSNNAELMMAEINFLEAKKYLADAHARNLRSQYLHNNTVIIDESNPVSDEDSEKDDEKICFITQLIKNEEERRLREEEEEEERKRREEEEEEEERKRKREEELLRQEEAEQKERDDIRDAEEKIRKQLSLKEGMRRSEELQKKERLADLRRKTEEKKKEDERKAKEEIRLEGERQAEQKRLEKEALEKSEEEERMRISEEEETKRKSEEEEKRKAEEEEKKKAEEKRKAEEEEEKQKMIAKQEMEEFSKYEEMFHNDQENSDDEEADEAMKLIDNLTLTPRPWAAIKDAQKVKKIVRIPKEYTAEEKEEVAYLKGKILVYRSHRKAMESKHHDLLIRLTEMESTWDEDEAPDFESKWRPKCKEEEERTPQLYERNRQLRLELQMLYKQADTIISKAQAKRTYNSRQGMAFPSLKNNLRINLQKLQADVTDLRKRSATAHIKVEAEKSNREAVEKEVKQLRQELINSKISSSVSKR